MSPEAACPHPWALPPLWSLEANEVPDEGGEDAMISRTEAKELINDLFEEEALVIGGLVAVHEVDDDLRGFNPDLRLERAAREEPRGDPQKGPAPARGQGPGGW